jgi:GrpB-like predicted nucleotidyltransferase (UPF0157 family)
MDVEDEGAFVEPIERLGFTLRYREQGHRYFRPPPGRLRAAQIHVCISGGAWERVHLLFRDYLRAHPGEAAAYARAKREAAAAHREDRVAYNDAKSPIIEVLLGRAEQWAERSGWTIERS